eukprot:767563-Hanusia_phi.AAC.1
MASTWKRGFRANLKQCFCQRVLPNQNDVGFLLPSSLLLSCLGFFVWRTLLSHPQLELKATTLHVYFPQDGSLSFNATAIAPPAVSKFHDVSIVSTQCNISLKKNQVILVHDLAQISVQGPIQLLKRNLHQDDAVQLLHGKIHLANFSTEQLALMLETNVSLGVSCSTLTSSRLYWSAFRVNRSDTFNDTIHNGFQSIRQTLQRNVTLSDMLGEFGRGVSVEDQRQALTKRIKLPVMRDSSGIFKAIYLHLPEISFDFNLGYLGDLSVRNPREVIDPSQAIVTFGSFPVTWLVVAGNETRAADDRAELFVSCVRQGCTRSIRAVVGALVGAFTTHPLQGVAISATASTTSAPFFVRLLGKQHLMVFRHENYRNRRAFTAMGEYSDCIKAGILDVWSLQMCINDGAIAHEATTDQIFLEYNKHPSAILVLATQNYFDSREGNPLFLVHLNVTALRKLTLGDVRSLLASDVAPGKVGSQIQDNAWTAECYIQVQESDNMLIQSYVESDVGMAQDTNIDSLNTVDTTFFALRVIDVDGRLVWAYAVEF